MSIKVLIADDHAVFRKGLRLLLEEEVDVEVVAEAADGEEAIVSASKYSPDVIVLDITMPNLDGIEACRKIIALAPETKIMALSIHDGERFVSDMLGAGAIGYVLKESAPEDLVEGIRTVMRGEVYLSPSIAGMVVSQYRKGHVRVEEESSESEQAKASTGPLLQTKLFRPPLSPAIILRTKQEEILTDCLHQPFSLLSAPAGYGKSTLIAQWLETIDLKSAWLSIDDDDNNVYGFLQYFVLAIKSMFPRSCTELSAYLEEIEDVSLASLLKAVTADLSKIKKPYVLVLDDYHLISVNSEVHKVIGALLEHPPPSLHLIIATRRNPPLPLASLRSQGKMNDLRLADLEFTLGEATKLLEQAAGCTLDPDAVAHVHTSTEGWAVGLRMAALAMRYHDDTNAFLSGFGGDVRQIKEYLITEVMEHEDPEIRDNLCKISVLDRFNARLCAAVCSEEGASSSDAFNDEIFEMLLERSGLLCIALDGTKTWYRYHHLFEELLYQQLQKRFPEEAIKGLHLKAAGWLEREGFLEEAMHHLSRAKAGKAMGGLILKNRRELYRKEQWLRLDTLLASVPTGVVSEDADLLMVKSWVGIIRQRHTEIWEYVARTEELLAEERCTDDLKPVFGQLDIFLSWRFYAAAEGEKALAHARSAVERLPISWEIERGYAQLMVCVCQQMEGRGAEGIQYIYDALETNRDAHPSYRIRLLEALGFVLWMGGDLKGLKEAGAAMIRLGEKESMPISIYNGHYQMGKALYALGDLELARKLLSAIIKPGYRATDRFLIRSSYLLAMTHEAQGRPEQALKLLNDMIAHLMDDSNSFSLTMVKAFQTELALRQNHLADAESWLASFEPSATPRGDVTTNDEITAVKVMLHQRTPESLKEAEKRSASLTSYFKKIHNTRFRVEALAVQALVFQALDKASRAESSLEEAVKLALPCGFIRLFVDLGPDMSRLLNRLKLNEEKLRYVGEIQSAFRGMNGDADLSDTVAIETITIPPATLGLLDPLTKREYEILALLIERRTNQEIADQLGISVKTVRRHTENIYGKLGVHGRHEAVAKAKGLGIIK